ARCQAVFHDIRGALAFDHRPGGVEVRSQSPALLFVHGPETGTVEDDGVALRHQAASHFPQRLVCARPLQFSGNPGADKRGAEDVFVEMDSREGWCECAGQGALAAAGLAVHLYNKEWSVCARPGRSHGAAAGSASASSSATFAAAFGAVMRASPTRTASAPAPAKRSTSAREVIPLSAARRVPSGTIEARRAVVPRSTLKLRRSRLLTPITAAPAFIARCISSLLLTSTRASIA